MSDFNENFAYQQLKRGLTDLPVSQTKVANAQINAKISQALKSYPAWAKAQRQATPPTQGQSAQQPNLNAAPTSIAGYDQRRATAAARAQADMARGGKPAPAPSATAQSAPKPSAQTGGSSVDINQLKQRSAQSSQASQAERDAARQQISATQASNAAAAKIDNELVAAVKAAKAKPPFARDAQDKLTLKRGAEKGIYEQQFSDLYAMLESVLYEETVDSGSFSNYIQKVLQIDLDSNLELAKTAGQIDTMFANNQSNDAYKLAKQLLQQYYQSQSMGKSNISTGISSSSATSTTDKIITNINSGRFNQSELESIIMQSLLRLKNKFPSEYNAIIRDVRTAVANYEANASQKTS